MHPNIGQCRCDGDNLLVLLLVGNIYATIVYTNYEVGGAYVLFIPRGQYWLIALWF